MVGFSTNEIPGTGLVQCEIGWAVCLNRNRVASCVAVVVIILVYSRCCVLPRREIEFCKT